MDSVEGGKEGLFSGRFEAAPKVCFVGWRLKVQVMEPMECRLPCCWIGVAVHRGDNFKVCVGAAVRVCASAV